MTDAWEQLRTWLWWLEPRRQIRGGLRYGYERNWHRSRKWRARKAREHESLLEDFHRGVGSKTLPLSYRYPHGVLTEQEGGAPNDALNWDTADHVCRRHRVIEHICRDREAIR